MINVKLYDMVNIMGEDVENFSIKSDVNANVMVDPTTFTILHGHNSFIFGDKIDVFLARGSFSKLVSDILNDELDDDTLMRLQLFVGE